MELLSIENGFPHPSYLPLKLGIPATVMNGGDDDAAESASSVEIAINSYCAIFEPAKQKGISGTRRLKRAPGKFNRSW